MPLCKAIYSHLQVALVITLEVVLKGPLLVITMAEYSRPGKRLSNWEVKFSRGDSLLL